MSMTGDTKYTDAAEYFNDRGIVRMLPLIDAPIPTSNKSRPWVNMSEYNGDCATDTALDLALKASLCDMKPDPYLVSLRFMDALKNGNLKEAHDIYKDTKFTCPEALELIHTDLDKIPWRISSEYHYESDRMLWLNSWIKIGWWNEYDTELASQLENAEWINDGSCRSGAIDTKSFRCVVWKGIGREMILRLVECDNITSSPISGRYQTNIELEKQGKYWVPISVAFSQAKDSKNILDLPEIEIGSLTELPDHNLDAERMLDKIVQLPNIQELRFYNGCTFGSAMCDSGALSCLDEDSADDFNSDSDSDSLDKGWTY